MAYEPPSPSRPWQLIDVLWQPLPPPRNGSPVASPSSPRKRSRDRTYEEEEGDVFSPQSRYPLMSNGHIHPSVPGPSSPSTSRSPSGTHARRASGSAFSHPHAHSPLASTRFERRSQSTSQHDRHPLPTTTQDVNAAKALTSMFESGSPKTKTRTPSGGHGRHASMPNGGSLLPPISTEVNGYRLSSPSRLSPLGKSPTLAAPSSNAREASDASTGRSKGSARRGSARKRSSDEAMDEDSDVKTKREHQTTPPDEADKDAAELMMYLAHSPSPARTLHASQSPSHRMSKSASDGAGGGGSAARVLFADTGNDYKVERHSNLVLAPPITAEHGS